MSDTTPPPNMARMQTVIEPRPGWRGISVREILEFRELLVILAVRDVKVRYKQAILGILWAVLKPMMTMIVFNVLFGLLMGRDNKPTAAGVPYAISTYAALVPWQMFATSVSGSSNSLVVNGALLKKVYFPKLIAPLYPILTTLIDFALSFSVLVVMVVGFHFYSDYEFQFSWALLALPLFIVLACATALSVGLWLAPINAIYRDVKYVIPFMVSLMQFVSPIVYTTDSILGDQPDWVRFVYGLNPMAGVAEGFRWALLGGVAPQPIVMLASTGMVLVLLVTGALFFRRNERYIVDLV